MRILHISTRLILGGSQENTLLSCEGQARLGHEVHLAFGPIYGPEGSLLQRIEAFNAAARADGRQPVVTHTVPAMVRDIRPAKDLACYFQLRELVRRLRPDVVHTHSSKAGIVGRFAAWAERKAAATAVVHTIHGPPFYQGQHWAVHWMYVTLERLAAARSHLIISVADAMTTLYRSKKIGRAQQYLTVRSGMETERFLQAAPGQSREDARASLGIPESAFVIGTVARLAEQKGHDDLLDALGEELRNRPTWRLLWVGDGWWRERLTARIESMGLSGQVIMTGLVGPDEVPGYIRAMDVLAHPSYREGLPRTVPQALLCGVCPIAYDVDGTAEALRTDGGNPTGVLVPLGDRTALREGIIKLASKPDWRRGMALRGRDYCKDRFSAKRMVDELEKVYTTALQLARPGLAVEATPRGSRA